MPAAPVAEVRGAREVVRVGQQVLDLRLAVVGLRLRRQVKAVGEQQRRERALIRAPGVPQRARVPIPEHAPLGTPQPGDALRQRPGLAVGEQARVGDCHQVAVGVRSGVLDLEAAGAGAHVPPPLVLGPGLGPARP